LSEAGQSQRISFHLLPDLSSILDLKAEYLQSLQAPLDGMWEVGFIGAAPHWEIQVDGERAGYYAANEEGTLLQFHVALDFQGHARTLFDQVLAQEVSSQKGIKQAIVATHDPLYLSLCLDLQKKVAVHTYLYELPPEWAPGEPLDEDLDFRAVTVPDLERTVAFQQACLGSEKDLSQWLRGYSANLMRRGEIFVLCRKDESGGTEWLGLGEFRKSDSQKGVVDLGMMVHPDHRGQGWATRILSYLTARSRAQELRAICSTTVENLGAQKAIARAGFLSRHRILNVAF